MQQGLRDELQGFTESTWILKHSTDPTTSLLRPYFIRAILEKKTFTTREVEQLAFQMIKDDPHQTVLKSASTSPTSAAASSSSSNNTKQQQKTVSDAATVAEVKIEPGTEKDNTTNEKKTITNNNNNYITVSPEHHQIAVRLINEFATFHRAEKIWHIKSGIVQFLAIA